jgi:uncharacterized protein
MTTKIYVNLVVKDLNKSIDFFTRLGFRFNPLFTDDTAACMIIGENIFSMLVTESKFKEFTRKKINDAHKFTETFISIELDSREKVDEMVYKAIAAGGASYFAAEDLGWMYQRSFEDLDGHQWELLFMNEEAMNREMERTSNHNTPS